MCRRINPLVATSLRGFVALVLLLATGVCVHAEAVASRYVFHFGRGDVARGVTRVDAATPYTPERGYGFDLGAGGADGRVEPATGIASDKPFFFSVKLPEGNYNVTVELGDPGRESTTTVKAESRRLMLEQVHTDAGQFITRTFTVNIRTPAIAGGGRVRLKAREHGYLHWDDKLTLEFNGQHPSLQAMTVEPAPDAVTLYLAGDSTVTDQPYEPWNSWGQMITRFFKPGLAVANHAESGEALYSFRAEKRLDKILSTIRPGDWLLVQMGHNDQKDKRPGSGAFTTYSDNLRFFIKAAREHQAHPVLITPMERRRFDAAGHPVDSLGDFPAAVRKVAKEEHVPLIDLNAMSKQFYAALGPKGSAVAFQDGTHHKAYGSYELARCVVEGIRADKLELAKFLMDDLPAFDPAHPDSPKTFDVPPSPAHDARKPDGN